MSFNPVSESLLFLRRAEAFSACTCFLDPMSLGHLWGYGGSGIFAAGGTETGLGWFCLCIATCFKTVIRCCCSLRLPICLPVMACPCFSLVPASKVLKECSISNSSGDVDREELADVLSLGLKRLTTAENCFQMMSQMKNYRCHLYWCSLYLSCQRENWAKTLKTH